MHVKLLFWMSVMLSIGNSLAIVAIVKNCTFCDVGNSADACVPPNPYVSDCHYGYEADEHCMTLSFGTTVVEKNCVTLDYVQKVGGQGNDCIQVKGDHYFAVDNGAVRRTLKEGGPKGRFIPDPSKSYEFCSCRGEICNSGDTSPFGANDPNYESLAPTTTASGGEITALSSQGFGTIMIIGVAIACRIYGF